MSNSESLAVRKRLLKAVLIGVGFLVLAWLLWLLVVHLATPTESKKKRAVQEIALLKPPPPPPPPKVAPPPPPKTEVQEKIDVPQDKPADKPAEAPPPGPDLAVDAAGSGSGDGFGLVGKKGGADLIGSGTGGTGGGNRFAWYGALVKDGIQEKVQEAVSKAKKWRDLDFRILVHVWVSATGAVTRAELVDSTGNDELDKVLQALLRNLPALREGAPADMAQPIKLRITAR